MTTLKHSSAYDFRSKRKPTAVERTSARGLAIEDVDTKLAQRLPGSDGTNEDVWIAGLRDDRGYYDHANSPVARGAHAAVRDAIRDFQDMFWEGIDKLNPDPLERRSLQLATGRLGMTQALLLSSGRVRWEASDILIKLVRDYWRRNDVPGRRWWFVTFLSDEGNALEYAPVFNFSAVQKNVYRLLSDARLSAVYGLEIQALTNFPDNGDGRSFMLHAHAIVWTDDPGFDVRKCRQKMCGSTRLRHWLGADTVEFVPLETERQITWRAYYLLKAPFMGKNFKPDRWMKHGFKLADARLRPDLAVRLMEGLTQIEFPQMVWGVGEGTAITRPWKKQLREWHAGKYCGTTPHLDRTFDLRGLWEVLNANRRSKKKRSPFQFTRGKRVPGATAWDAAAARRMEKERLKALQKRPTSVPKSRRSGLKIRPRPPSPLDDL